MRTSALALACPLLVMLAAHPSAARAQTPAPATPSAADVAFREGREAAKSGDWAKACARFNESQRLEPTRGTLLNIADCEEHLGKLLAAREHFGVVAAAFPPGDERHTIAVTRGAAVAKRIAHVTLRLAPSAPAGTVVRQGGVVVDAATFGHAVDADPGAMSLVVSAPGHVDRTYDVTVGEGATLEVSVDVGAETPPAANDANATNVPTAVPPAAAEAPRATNPKRTIGLVVGAVGVVSLGVGAVAGILAIDKANTVKSHCDASNACDPQGVDAGNAGQTLAPLSTITIVAGAALVGVGAYFFFTSGGFGQAKAPHAAFVPIVSPSGGGGAWVQTF